MSKLGEITLNGKAVSVFSPPHDEPDFPWVDIEELAKAFLPRADARRIVKNTHSFGGDKRMYATAVNGDRIATIVCHALAQGLCGMVDHLHGHPDSDDGGPAHQAYSLALGVFAADNCPMSFEGIAHAFRNPGGKFLRDSEVLKA